MTTASASTDTPSIPRFADSAANADKAETSMTGSKNGRNVGTLERGISSVVGGLMLIDAIRRRNMSAVVEGILGGSLIHRGTTGSCKLYHALGVNTANGGSAQVRVQDSVVVNKDPMSVYLFWRELTNLPRFMNHLQSVSVQDDKRSHWVAKGPAGTTVEWDAQIVNDVPGHHIAWKSIPGSTIENYGAVGFVPVQSGRATRIKVSLQYSPPGGVAGVAVAKLFGEEPSKQIREDLRQLKATMEEDKSMIPTAVGA